MSNPQEEDNKPIDQEAQIILKVTSQDGDEILFKMKKSTQMYAYCDRPGLAFGFLFDGCRIRCEQTPEEMRYMRAER